MRRLLFDQNPVKGGKQPQHILVDGCWRPVEHIVDHWRETGRWWAEENPRDFFLAETERRVFIVSRNRAGWRIDRVMD